MRPLLLGLLTIAIGLTAAWFIDIAYLTTPSAGEAVSITVRDGTKTGVVASTLAKDGLVPSAWLYDVFSFVHGSARHPMAGTYAFRRGTSFRLIADTIARGPTREIETVRITEGETIGDEAAAIETYGVTPSAFAATVGSAPSKTAAVHPFDRSLADKHPVLQEIPMGQSLEGYLFPDTYEVWKDELPQSLIEKQLKTFESKVIDPLDADRKASGMSWHEVVTLASIVEAEVQTPEDRKIVAGIFLNRINNGIRLQSDATLNYVIGAGRARATAEDLALNSPYNTYSNDGLPPGPIGNPGFSAIDAVVHPTKTEYLYFLTDKNGKVLYAKTYEEHLRNKEKAFK